MKLSSLTRGQLRTLLDYAEKNGTMSFNLETTKMPSNLCRYKSLGRCVLRDICCPSLSFGCDCMCLRTTELKDYEIHEKSH